MAEYVLETRGITKEFPGVRALDNVSFSARAGEILALVGENGAGKSTLMKILSGAYAENSYDGEIYVGGERQHFMTTTDSEKAGIAMIYQEIIMHFALTVGENMCVGKWPKKSNGVSVNWKKLYADAEAQLKTIGLDVDVRTQLRNLNTSQMQMVTIAREVAKNPRILILDEPTSALTNAEAEKLFVLLHKLKAQGMAIILISHKMDEVFENADRITVLRDGQTINSHLTSEVERSTIITEMVGRELKNFYPVKDYTPSDEILLRAEHYTVEHPFATERNIVEDFSFHLRRGEILGFAGLVGAGRSELVNALFGKTQKIAGELELEGKPLKIREPYDAVSAGLALVTENRKEDGFVGPMSIQRNICLAGFHKIAKGFHVSAKLERGYARKYFDALSIRAPSLNTFVETLSGGNQQKVIVGKWLMADPKVLILDEPTKGIDVTTKAAIYQLMVDLVKQGISIIMISSEMPELVAMSDRVIVFNAGRKAAELTEDEINQYRIMEYATMNFS